MRLRSILTSAIAAAVISCGGGDGGSTGPDLVVATVTIDGSATPMSPGETLQLTAVPKNAGGAAFTGMTATWSSSNQAVATVNASGLVSAVANGTTTISATISGKTGERVISVQPFDNTVATVTITPSTTAISPGSTLQLTATPTNPVGKPITGLTATWSSSNQSVATVSSSGLVTGVANGSTTITATISQKEGVRLLNVQTINAGPSATVNAGIDNLFTPSQVDIIAGGQVTWNFGVSAHNVTFGGTTGAPANINDTANNSVSRTFNVAGTFGYACTLHPGMTGTVVVH